MATCCLPVRAMGRHFSGKVVYPALSPSSARCEWHWRNLKANLFERRGKKDSPRIRMSHGRATEDKNARSALACGSSSYRLPPAVHTETAQGAPKAAAAATALQGAFGTVIFMAETQKSQGKALPPRLFTFAQFALCLLTFSCCPAPPARVASRLRSLFISLDNSIDVVYTLFARRCAHADR